MSKPSAPTPHWDARYGGNDFLFGTKPNDFLKSVSDSLKPAANILCLADGEGRNGVYLASLGHHVTSIDQSVVGLAKAQALAAKHNVSIETIQADLSDYDFSDSDFSNSDFSNSDLGERQWDCIVSIFFHMPLALKDIIYPRVIRALAPNGKFILESYRPEQLNMGTGGPPLAENMLTKQEIESRFSALTTLHLSSIEREVIEGTGHTGQAAVVQFIGQKL